MDFLVHSSASKSYPVDSEKVLPYRASAVARNLPAKIDPSLEFHVGDERPVALHQENRP
jgi:hypothetical protein